MFQHIHRRQHLKPLTQSQKLTLGVVALLAGMLIPLSAWDLQIHKDPQVLSAILPATPPVTSPYATLPIADFTRDWQVDIKDYNLAAYDYGHTDCNSRSDANKDCDVDSPDIELVIRDHNLQQPWKTMVTTGAALYGSPTAKVQIIAFIDYQCPFCQRFHQETYPLIEKNYIHTGKANYIVHDLPLTFHANAYEAAAAARCAGVQGKYHAMADTLFRNLSQWAGNSQPFYQFRMYAYGNGVDLSPYDYCYQTGYYDDLINQDIELAQAAGANGTPTFFINGQILVGAHPYDTFEQIIETALTQ